MNQKNYQMEIKSLKDSLTQRNKEYDTLQSSHNELTEKYTKLNAKFEGIKNLFS